MKLEELREAWMDGKIDKRLYWQIVRENYIHVLPQIQKVVEKNDEVMSVSITKEGVILQKRGGEYLFFDFRQAICRAEMDLLLIGDPEKDDMDYIDKYLSGNKGGTLLDIGANVGMFSLHFYQKHSEMKYYLFEPIPDTFKWLQKNAKLNMVDLNRYCPFNVGMSNEKGQFDFFVPASNEAASLVANDDSFFRKRAGEDGEYTGNTDIDKVTCIVYTVDDFVKEHGIENISLVKIDVEGNEFKVLKGAQETLKKYKPLVYCELLRKHAKRFGYHPNDVIEYMSKLGYACLTMRAGKLIHVDAITEETEETNFFFSAD